MELFRQALEKETDLRITYILQPEPKGLAHAVTCAEGFVDEKDFLVVLGDNLLGEGLGPVLDRFRAGSAHIVALSEVEDPRQFGVAVVEGGRSRGASLAGGPRCTDLPFLVETAWRWLRKKYA